MSDASSRPLRILHVTDVLGEGGAEQNLLTLIRALGPPAVEHHVAWLYDDEPPTMSERFRPHVAGLHPLCSGHGLGHLRAAARLARLIRQLEPDLVNGKCVRAAITTRLAAKMAPGPAVMTTWEVVSYRPDMMKGLGPKGPIYRELLRAADAVTGLIDDRVIAVSRQVAEYNGSKLWTRADRVSVIYNAMDPSRLAHPTPAELETLRRELKLAPGAPVLLSVAHLNHQKSHDTSIAAMRRVVDKHPDAVLLIAGAGHLRDELQRQADQLGLQRHVRLLGARKDVPLLLRMADLFVFPSIYEGQGIALMEAVASELPVVASRIPTTLEVIEGLRSVLLFEPRDSDGMARAILDALSRLAELRALARKDSSTLLRRFSVEAMARSFYDLACQMTGRAPTAVTAG